MGTKIICISFISLAIFTVITGLIIGFVILLRKPAKDSCSLSCLNGGSCSRLNTCTCPHGWTGSICQTYTCEGGCKNGGWCSGPNKCTCPLGWFGLVCDTYTCTRPCQHGGYCSAPNVCTCLPGWTGATCERYTCTPPCQYGGYCSGPNVCTCLPGWTGATCERYTCMHSCMNGGWCSGPNTCTCQKPYYGARCENKENEGTCYYGKDSVSLVDGGTRLIEELKIGDRVWSINPKQPNELIQDEIVLMMHNGPNATVRFYTFIADDGAQVSLTGAHNIPIFDPTKKEIKIIRASNVTLQHRLILHGQTTSIREIRITHLQGFYSPLTLTSYLLVNRILTNVFSDSYDVSPDVVHLFLGPVRLYYRATRFLFGPQYRSFEEIKEGLHPIAKFYKTFHSRFRWIIGPFQLITTVLPVTILLFVIRYLLNQKIPIKR